MALVVWLMGCTPAEPPPLLSPTPSHTPTQTLPTPRPVLTATLPPPALLVSTAEPTPTTPAVTFTSTPTPPPLPTPNFTQIQWLDEPPPQVPCEGTGLVFQSRFPSQVVDPWRYYSAYLPPCFGYDGRVYPVLYLFHGSIQTDSHWLDLGLVAQLEQGIQSGLYPPFIVILPYNGNAGNNTSGGIGSVEDITVENLLPYVEKTLCGWPDPRGRSIGGISRGGYWALMIAFRHAHLFGAVSGHTSQLQIETDGPEYNPLETYKTADLSQMRIWLDWGDKDFLRPGQNALTAALTQANIAHEVHVYPGLHNEAYWAENLPKYITWHAIGWPRDRRLYPTCERQ